MKEKTEKEIKREEKIKDIFIDYLKKIFNESYVTIGEAVKANNGKKDFEYLLKSDDGNTMALEITSVTKSSISNRPSKLPLFETFFKELLDNGNGLPSIIFTILEPKVITEKGESGISDNKIKSILQKKSQSLKDEISREIQKLPLYEKHNITVAEGIYLSVERGMGKNELQFYPYSSHISIIDFDDDRYEYSEEYKVYEQLKAIIPKKNDSLDYVADRRVLLIGDVRETLGTNKVLKYAMIKFIKEFPSQLTNVDEIFVCCWNYEGKRPIFDKIYP